MFLFNTTRQKYGFLQQYVINPSTRLPPRFELPSAPVRMANSQECSEVYSKTLGAYYIAKCWPRYSTSVPLVPTLVASQLFFPSSPCSVQDNICPWELPCVTLSNNKFSPDTGAGCIKFEYLITRKERAKTLTQGSGFLMETWCASCNLWFHPKELEFVL